MNGHQPPHHKVSWFKHDVHYSRWIYANLNEFIVLRQAFHNLAIAVIGKTEIPHGVTTRNYLQATIFWSGSVNCQTHSDSVAHDIFIRLSAFTET